MFIGIGNPPGTMDLRAYLLQKFSVEERKQVTASLLPSVNWFSSSIIAKYITVLCYYELWLWNILVVNRWIETNLTKIT